MDTHPRPTVRSLCGSALFCLLVTMTALDVVGQSGIGEVTLFGEEEFTIEAATKTEIPLSKAPGSVTVISAQQIRESGSRTIPELLRLVAGVNVRWNPMVQSLDMRSFGQNPFTSRVLLLIDGVPYNSWNKGGFPQHPGFDFFMLQNIKRLEIVRGPGSSLYGENAYWGVINIVTLSGEDLQGGRVEIYGGDLESQSVAGVYGKTFGEASILASARVQQGQLPMAFWFDDADSTVEGTDIFLKGTYKNIELSYFRHEDEVDGFDSPLDFFPGATFRSAETIGQTVDIVALKASHEIRTDLTIDADISYAQRNGSQCSSCHALPADEAEFSREVGHGSQWIADVRMNLRMVPSHDILIGVEGRRVDTGNHDGQLLTPAEDPRVIQEYTKFAAYVQDQISLADDKVRVTLGARYDGSNDLFDSEISPRVAVVYTPNDRWALRGGWSTAYRYPNFNELYTDSWFFSAETPFFALPLAVFEPNPELQPEQIRTVDLGVEYRASSTFSTKLDVYQSEIDDFIVLAFRGGGPTRIRSENHPDGATIRGLELELRWRPTERFTGFFNYAYQENEQDGTLVDSSGRPYEFVYSPENKINLGLYFGPWSGVRGAVELQWRDTVQAPGAWNFEGGGATAELDGYTMLNARISWDLPISLGNAEEAIRFTLHGRNLLDEEIVETFLPINMQLPGSTFYGAIEVRY
ncbi:MAG: TonB-dependent receptor [Acidobacteriota bacterium]